MLKKVWGGYPEKKEKENSRPLIFLSDAKGM